MNYEQHTKRFYEPAIAALKQKVGDGLKIKNKVMDYNGRFIKMFYVEKEQGNIFTIADAHKSEFLKEI